MICYSGGMISLIAAVDKNHGIGSGGRPLWTDGLPADSQRFRALTSGGTVIMGRKAFESFHGVLLGRQNIVVSHRLLRYSGVTFVHSLDEAYSEATSTDISIIGGANIFSQAIDQADRIYLTEVDYAFDDVDVFFPRIDLRKWREVRREEYAADGRNVFNYSFIVYARIKAKDEARKKPS